ncbi:MAG: type VI secretion system protein TssA [Methylovirgula sp.]
MSQGPSALFADARIAIGAQPVSSEAPAGADIRRDPDFETLEAEIRRMDADGPTAVRWRNVVDNASEILAHRSKDLLVGVWLTYGLTREEEWQGLAVGLSILRDMVGDHWDAMQPTVKRERARVGAAEWLVGRLVPLVAEWPTDGAAAPEILAATSALDEVERIMNERLTKENVAFGELVRSLRPHADAARRVVAEAAERAAREAAQQRAAMEKPVAAEGQPADADAATAPIAVASALQTPVRVAAPAAPIAAAPTSVGPDLDRAVSQLETAMRQHAEALRLANLFDPRSYVLLRTATWLGISQLPPQQNGRTLLPPPPNDRLAAVETMRQAGKQEDAVRALESLISSSPFCLDAQRQVHDVLSGFGAQGEAAKAAVATLVSGFIRRLRGVEDLTFNDGRPFANAATREWLASLAPQADGAQNAGEADLGSAKAAVQLASSGKLPEAFALLSEELRHAGGGRTRFSLQLLEAQICLDANLPAMAVPLVIGLTRTASEYNLDRWEPSLAARAAEITVRALTHADAVKFAVESERLATLQAARIRLAGLDPAAAARFIR